MNTIELKKNLSGIFLKQFLHIIWAKT